MGYKTAGSSIIWAFRNIQNVPRGRVNILGGHKIGHSKQKVYMYMCPIPNGFLDWAISLYSCRFNDKKEITCCL